MAEENKNNSRRNKLNKLLKGKGEIGKISKLNEVTGEIEEIDLNNLSDEELEDLNKAFLKVVKELEKDLKENMENKSKDQKDKDNKENNMLDTRESLMLEKAKQDLNMNSHQVEKNKLFTLFDIITNTKELLVQRMNEHGKVDLQHCLEEEPRRAANNVISLALKQVYLWIEKNDINGIKPNFKPTNPGDITDKNLYK